MCAAGCAGQRRVCSAARYLWAAWAEMGLQGGRAEAAVYACRRPPRDRTLDCYLHTAGAIETVRYKVVHRCDIRGRFEAAAAANPDITPQDGFTIPMRCRGHRAAAAASGWAGAGEAGIGCLLLLCGAAAYATCLAAGHGQMPRVHASTARAVHHKCFCPPHLTPHWHPPRAVCGGSSSPTSCWGSARCLPLSASWSCSTHRCAR